MATAASVVAFSCGGGSLGEVWSDAGADAAAPDAGRRPIGNTEEDAGPREPEYDDDGWLRIDVDPGYECPNYTPTRADQMPPSIEWEPCPEHMLAAYPSCMRMKTDGAFNARLNGFDVAGSTGLVDPDGKVILAFVRGSANVTHYLVGEADGPIRHAVHYGAGACRLGAVRVARGRALYQLYRKDEGEDGRLSGYRWGAIGGAFDEPAVVLESLVGDYRSYSAGPDMFLDGNAFRAWAPNAPVLSSLGESAHYSEPGIFIGDALFFRTNLGMDEHRVRIHQPGTGVRDFLWYGDDIASAAASFGTDGKDMVWIEAFGRTYVGDTWSAIDLVTAPYGTDPSKIEKRRLRSMETLDPSPFVVGCGHAAPSSLHGSGKTITRLSDGSFTPFDAVPGADGGGGSYFTGTLAITCDEVFAEMLDIEPYGHRVVRIRLGDFGLGNAPDGGR